VCQPELCKGVVATTESSLEGGEFVEGRLGVNE
jgi:hypothetical protein